MLEIVLALPHETRGNRQQNHGSTASAWRYIRKGAQRTQAGDWGLRVRNGRYYAQLTFTDGNTGQQKVRRVPVLDKDQSPVSTVAQAIEAMNKLKVKRSEDNLPVLRRTPKFKDFVQVYLTTS